MPEDLHKLEYKLVPEDLQKLEYQMRMTDDKVRIMSDDRCQEVISYKRCGCVGHLGIGELIML